MTDRMHFKSTTDSSSNVLMFSYNGKSCPLSEVVLANEIDEHFLQCLLSGIEELHRKHGSAGSQIAWLNVKCDILFQMYLCVLQEATTNSNGSSSENLRPSTMSIATKVESLMEKCKSFCCTHNTGALHPTDAQHLQTLCIDETDAGTTDAKTTQKDGEAHVPKGKKILDLLKEHCIEIFRQKIIRFAQTVEEEVLSTPVSVKAECVNQRSASAPHPLGTGSLSPTTSSGGEKKRKSSTQDATDAAIATHDHVQDEEPRSLADHIRAKYRREQERLSKGCDKEEIKKNSIQNEGTKEADGMEENEEEEESDHNDEDEKDEMPRNKKAREAAAEQQKVAYEKAVYQSKLEKRQMRFKSEFLDCLEREEELTGGTAATSGAGVSHGSSASNTFVFTGDAGVFNGLSFKRTTFKSPVVGFDVEKLEFENGMILLNIGGLWKSGGEGTVFSSW